MKVLLTPAMAKELYENEDMIKAQEGPYRPQYNVALKQFEPVIKCWPLEPFKGTCIQEREVIPGMENEVDDICMAKIEDDKITYKVMDTPTNLQWDTYTLDQYNLIIYTPNFNERTIVLAEPTLQALFGRLKEYKIVGEKDEEERNKGRMAWSVFFPNKLDDWFKRYQGICTYIYLEGDGVMKVGKWDNKKYW